MSQEERYGNRDGAYSAWHRRSSTGRYVGIERAQTLAMIDIDATLYVEYDDGTKEPIALIETAQDIGQDYKNATVTRNLARRSNLPGLVVLYRCSDMPNPADLRYQDIEKFRVKRIYPQEETKWRELTPSEYAALLCRMREWKTGMLDNELFSSGEVF